VLLVTTLGAASAADDVTRHGRSFACSHLFARRLASSYSLDPRRRSGDQLRAEKPLRTLTLVPSCSEHVPQHLSSLIGQIVERNPYVASRRASEVLPSDLLQFLRKIRVDAIRIQRLLV
jgi:hypothetical protein